MLLSAEAVDGAPAGARAWRIRYLSSNDKGKIEQVTAMVVAPDRPPPRMGRKVLAWAHGTWGVTQHCAPSLDQAAFFQATPGLELALAKDYVVVATDYAGLGTPQQHPFLVGSIAAYNVLDSIRAARALPDSGAGNRFAVWGESQGGHSALFTGQYAKHYAPELSLVGVAAAAPPTDLPENLAKGSDPSTRAFMTAYAAYSWSRHFGHPLASLGKKSTGEIIEKLAQKCVKLDSKPNLGTIIGVTVLRTRLKSVNLGNIEPWASTARANSVSTQPYGIPFLIAQNSKDTLVAPAVTRAFARKLCRNRATVRYLDIVSSTGHTTTGRDSEVETMDWIDARFAGAAPPNGCARI